ncbi:MAG: DUF488 domain-containing protein [Chloroflexi bacterium]|nr:DUF488 domain-containing protein [Chloroflexota bacterium]
MDQTPIYTIGYGAREMDAFIAALKAHEIAYLIDVRSKPYSRYKPDFSKQALEQHLKNNDVRYVFMGDTLGGQPDDLECYTDGKVDYEKMRQKSFYREGISRLREAYSQALRVVLMCSEGKPEMCHRSKLIGETLAAEGITIAHIDENDRLIAQEDAVLRLSKGQPSLFDDFFQYTSRKRYVDDDEDEEGE